MVKKAIDLTKAVDLQRETKVRCVHSPPECTIVLSREPSPRRKFACHLFSLFLRSEEENEDVFTVINSLIKVPSLCCWVFKSADIVQMKAR